MNSFLSNVIKGIDNTNILADGGNSSEFTGTIDTGSYIMNAVLSGSLYGGVPNNKITAFAGESATGKTFFVLGVIKQFLEDKGHDTTNCQWMETNGKVITYDISNEILDYGWKKVDRYDINNDGTREICG